MFTGIISHQAIINDIKFNSKKDAFLQIKINKSQIKRTLKIGCSIACNGICLTLIKKTINYKFLLLDFEASKETCNKTTIKNWQKNQEINLEFAMKINDEFGGHLVQGHIDDIAKIKSIKSIQDSWEFIFSYPQNLQKFIAKKGSITIDGTSLTVNDLCENKFSVNIIKHTFKNTIFKNYQKGDKVNLEIDSIARYLSNLINNYVQK